MGVQGLSSTPAGFECPTLPRSPYLERVTHPPHDDPQPERTPGGSVIHRNQAREPQFSPESDDPLREAYETHYASAFGTEPRVFHEIISPIVHVDIYHYPPTRERPHHVLATLGMSDLPMHVPDEVDLWTRDQGQPSLKRAEIMLALPESWPLTQTAFQQEQHYWPVRLLKTLARMPHEYITWLGWGHTVPNGNPAEPYHDSVPFTGVLLASPVLAGHDVSSFTVTTSDGRVRGGHLYAALPLTSDEMEHKLQYGTDALLEHLAARAVTELVDVKRRSVLKRAPRRKRFGLF